jgi:hypothetical protein
MLLLLEVWCGTRGQTRQKVFFVHPQARLSVNLTKDDSDPSYVTSWREMLTTAIAGRPPLILAVCLASLAANCGAFNSAGFQTISSRFSPALRSTGFAAQGSLPGQRAACKNDGEKVAKWSMQGNSLERRELFALGTGLSKCIVYSRHIFMKTPTVAASSSTTRWTPFIPHWLHMKRSFSYVTDPVFFVRWMAITQFLLVQPPLPRRQSSRLPPAKRTLT